VSEASSVRLRVDEATAERLDAYMANRLPGFSRTRIVQLIEAGHVRVNGAVPRKRDRPAAGDVIEMDVPPAEPSHIEAEPIPLSIAFEDEELLVIDKPAGLVVHPAPGHARGTLVNALLHHIPDLAGIGGVRRPGLVHRLDRDTSGLLVVAKTEAAHRSLSAALKRREIRRLYRCVAWGHVDAAEITVDQPIGRSPSNRKRMAVVQDGRPAITHLRRLERWRAVDYLEARLETGRTHQIRVHLASLGHAVVGDREYGAGAERGTSGPQRLWARHLAGMLERQFLHAAELAFRHPRTNEVMVFRSPLPEDLAATAEWARDTSSR
jgi:23S rRNA pseudouridine1911/1915/1917 synthase